MNKIKNYLEEVKKNGYALGDIIEQTPEICLAAVNNAGCAVRFVKEQTPEICLAAVNNTGFALQYVKEQTYEICLAAIKQNITSIVHVRDANILNDICNEQNILYLPQTQHNNYLILKLVDGEYKCWIGCQDNITLEKLLWRIHYTDGGLKNNRYRQIYIDFLKKHNLYSEIQ